MYGLLLVVICIGLSAEVAADDQRYQSFVELNTEYEAELAESRKDSAPDEPSDEEIIARHQQWPGWEYLPRVLRLAEENPEDDTALACCHWIFDRCGNVGNSQRIIYDADSAAWRLVSRYQNQSSDLPLLCLRAVQYPSPAREEFLRSLIQDYRQSVEVHGFAFLALAELLAHRYESVLHGGPGNWPEPKTQLERYWQEQSSLEWKQYMTVTEPEKLRLESCDLFRHVLEHYADIPVTITAPYFRNLKTLGEKASKSLNALERLQIGRKAPEIAGIDIDGRPLRLKDYRGRVVLLSFWFSGCGPCMDLVPEERSLVEKYGEKNLAVLGVCSDADQSIAKRTITEHGMNWPCWHDSEQSIHTQYNVLGWPTFYLLDQSGKIAAKQMSPEDLDAEIAKLLEHGTGG